MVPVAIYGIAIPCIRVLSSMKTLRIAVLLVTCSGYYLAISFFIKTIRINCSYMLQLIRHGIFPYTISKTMHAFTMCHQA